jgi:DNA topoisomerase-3
VILVVAEKPSVARDLARALGVPARGSPFRGARHVITWCIGHLVELEEPATYDPKWKRWRIDTLPILPSAFQWRPSRQTISQWRVVRDCLRSREFTEVVNACDAGREGELIFRSCYDLAGSRLPVRRLWISSMTDEALRAGLAALAPGARWDALADAARCRSEADWLVGMNATRAVTVRSGVLCSIGRVQTPTLALLVRREQAIRAFVPEAYWEVDGRFPFVAKWTLGAATRIGAAEIARAIVARCGPAVVEKVETERTREPPPPLFDLTSLQRTANRRYGFSAKRTLDLAQSLYERRKAITYPRTDSKHLPREMASECARIIGLLAEDPTYAPVARIVTQPGRRVFDDAKVSDHHAIIPTGRGGSGLDADERRLYDLIVRRFIGAFWPDAEIDRTTVILRAGDGPAAPPMKKDGVVRTLPPPPDRFIARGRVRVVDGWQAVAGIAPPADALPRLTEGVRLPGTYSALEKKTEPPPRFTDATLLAAMESAGKELDDEALREAMRDRGLGTPATRAQTIETLLERGYISRSEKSLVPTPLGIALIEGLPMPSLASAELTGEWEARLARMARGQDARPAFMRDIDAYVRKIVDEARAAPQIAAPAREPVGRCPRCGRDVVEKLKFFACSACDFKLWKRIAGKAVSAKLAAVLLRVGKTQILPGFRSKAGKRFSAALRLTDGEVKLDFGSASAPAPAPATATGSGPGPGPGSGSGSAPEARSPRPEALTCPSCKEGSVIPGKRAWGCSRWREGCKFVIPFTPPGAPRRLTATELRDLVTKGKTRRAAWGRLVLDRDRDGGQVRHES